MTTLLELPEAPPVRRETMPRRPETATPRRTAPPARRIPARPLAPCPTTRAVVETRPLRITRRGRLLRTLSVVLAGVGLIGLAAWQADPGAGGLAQAPRTVVVEPGDSLWLIAREIAPAESPADVVSLLRAANDLGTQPLRPGQVLVVPTG